MFGSKHPHLRLVPRKKGPEKPTLFEREVSGRLQCMIREIKNELTRRGYQDSQNAAGSRAGIDSGSVSRYTNEKLKALPNAATLYKIKQRTNVDVNWLLTGEGAAWKISDAPAELLAPPPTPNPTKKSRRPKRVA